MTFSTEVVPWESADTLRRSLPPLETIDAPLSRAIESDSAVKLPGRGWTSHEWLDDPKSSEAREVDFLLGRRKERTSPSRVPRVEESPATELLAEWDGYILDIDDHHFVASLKGVFGNGVEGETEIAEIPISDVNRSELDLFQLGGIFRLCVLHEELSNGQPRRFTQVVLRRLPAYRLRDITAAEDRANLVHQRLRVE